MGKEKDIKDKKKHFIGIRLTTDEYNKILSDMEQSGYLSISKYVRERLLKRKITLIREVTTDRDIKNQINRLSTEISRIGSNYNNVVRKYSAACNYVKNDGSPAITTRSTNYYMNKLMKMTEEVKDLMNSVIKTIDNCK